MIKKNYLKKKCNIFITGKENSGVSTFVNSIFKKNIAISMNCRTTLIINNIHIELFCVSYKIIYPKSKLKKIFTNKAILKLSIINFICIIIDVSKKVLIEKYHSIQRKHIIIILNKSDIVKKKDVILETISKLKKLGLNNIFIISAINNEGVSDIIKYIYFKTENQKSINCEIIKCKCNTKEIFYKIVLKIVKHKYSFKINFWKENKSVLTVGYSINSNNIENIKNNFCNIKRINIKIKTELEKLIKKKARLYSFF